MQILTTDKNMRLLREYCAGRNIYLPIFRPELVAERLKSSFAHTSLEPRKVNRITRIGKKKCGNQKSFIPYCSDEIKFEEDYCFNSWYKEQRQVDKLRLLRLRKERAERYENRRTLIDNELAQKHFEWNINNYLREDRTKKSTETQAYEHKGECNPNPCFANTTCEVSTKSCRSTSCVSNTIQKSARKRGSSTTPYSCDEENDGKGNSSKKTPYGKFVLPSVKLEEPEDEMHEDITHKHQKLSEVVINPDALSTLTPPPRCNGEKEDSDSDDRSFEQKNNIDISGPVVDPCFIPRQSSEAKDDLIGKLSIDEQSMLPRCFTEEKSLSKCRECSRDHRSSVEKMRSEIMKLLSTPIKQSKKNWRQRKGNGSRMSVDNLKELAQALITRIENLTLDEENCMRDEEI